MRGILKIENALFKHWLADAIISMKTLNDLARKAMKRIDGESGDRIEIV